MYVKYHNNEFSVIPNFLFQDIHYDTSVNQIQEYKA